MDLDQVDRVLADVTEGPFDLRARLIRIGRSTAPCCDIDLGRPEHFVRRPEFLHEPPRDSFGRAIAGCGIENCPAVVEQGLQNVS